MKLQKIKTIESRIWKLCKEITRMQYVNTCFACGKENLEGKQLHTSHLFRKKFIPIQMKYDLRLLRNCCNVCNLRLYGNLEWYFTNLLRVHEKQYVLDIADDILYYKTIKMTTPETRSFLLNLEAKYIAYARNLETNKRI